MGDMEAGNCLGHSDCEMVEFSILDEVKRMDCKTTTLDFRKVDFELFRMLVGRDP